MLTFIISVSYLQVSYSIGTDGNLLHILLLLLFVMV